MHIVGIDGGLSHMGVALMHFDSGARNSSVVSMKTIETERSDKKRSVRESEDVVRRAREVWSWLELELYERDVRVVCMETLSLPRNAGSSAKIGVALGVVVAVAASKNLPIVQASPQEVKAKIARARNASKDDVELQVRQRYPSTAAFLDAMRKGDREHAADAVAVIHACLDSDVVRAAMRAAG